VAESKDIEHQATEKVCDAIATRFEAIPDCTKLLDSAWDKVAAMCPQGFKSLQQFPPGMMHKIEQLACQVAERKDIEDMATAKVCSLIANEFKPIPDCIRLLDVAWDTVAAVCPQGHESFIHKLEKLVCQVAENKDIEKKGTEKICAAIADKYKPIPHCKKMLDDVWDQMDLTCRQDYAGMIRRLERVVCKVADKKDIEDKATTKICATIAAQFRPIPDCQKLLDDAWDKIVAKCPKGFEGLGQDGNALHHPGMIRRLERIVCKVADKKDIEDKATTKICATIAAQFRPIPDCQKLLDDAWDKIVAKCPKGFEGLGQDGNALHHPGMIRWLERVVCKVADKKDIEDKATTNICATIAAQFRPIPDCQKLLDDAWDKIVAKCPKGQETAGSVFV